MEENKIYCSHCGVLIDSDDYGTINGEIVCADCIERLTTTCDRCGATIWEADAYGDEYTNLCRHCYENHYTRCSCCDSLVHEDDAYHLNGYDYCSDCYHDEVDRSRSIHDYSYKPEPIFYDDSDRYFGVELEIDGAGKDSDNADDLLEIANVSDEHIYIKSDGSLDDGIEIVSHPMTLDYHKNFCWEDIMRKAISLGYRSHQTSTCGLHIHVNRDCLGEDRDDQEMVISKILYFTERHWNELLKFSRRSEYSMNRWAARYGFEKTGREILDKAKKGNNGRYAAVNLIRFGVPQGNIIIDKCSGKDTEREEYQYLKRQILRKGDTLVIKELDRLSRNKSDIKRELEYFKDMGIRIKILDIPTTLTAFPAEQMWVMDMINSILIEVLGSIAENERNKIRSRQREGIEAAKKKNVRFGRPATPLPGNWEQVMAKVRSGTKKPVEAIRELGISRSCYYRLYNKMCFG